ncbi:MAG: hypothetical protein KGH71_05045 [Candidatus Micrarchaeota archaeon]|nr:hypothetical protein [Candidatus Micrarchaeota archaeon]
MENRKENVKKVERVEELIKGLRRDGTTTTFNKVMDILATRKDLDVGEFERIRSFAECLQCNRIYCDHPRS